MAVINILFTKVYSELQTVMSKQYMLNEYLNKLVNRNYNLLDCPECLFFNGYLPSKIRATNVHILGQFDNMNTWINLHH